MEEQVISFNLTNNTNGTIPMSIMGNNTDVMDNSNATTQYYWNLTGFSVTTENTITIQYKYVGQTSFTSISVPFSGTNLQNIADALNTLNIGTFFLTTSGGNTYLNNYTQYLVYGQLDVTSSAIVSGSLNTSFAVGSTGFNGTVYSIGIQSDGKILAVGNFTTFNGNAFGGIVRLNTDGTIDTTFNFGGAGISGGLGNGIQSVQIQTDGNIIIVGDFTSYNGTGANGIVRLTTSGAIDGTFAYGTGFGGGGIPLQAIIQPSDGKIVVIGSFGTYQGNASVEIVRINTNGSYDPTLVPTGTSFNSNPNCIAIQSDGKFIVGGTFTSYNGVSANGIIRLNTTGSRDATFVVGTGFNNTVSQVQIQSDGNIICSGGFTTYKGTSASGIVRLNTIGTIDATFVYGTGFNVAGVNSLLLQSNGKILCGGSFSSYNGTLANNIIRLNSNGSVDTSFIYGSGFNNYVFVMGLSNTTYTIVGGFTTYNGTTVGSGLINIASIYQ